VFVRDRRTGRTSLASAPSHAPGAPSPLDKLLRARLATLTGTRPARAVSRATVKIEDNDFTWRGGAPTIRLRRGATVTWRWGSQQSHRLVGNAEDGRLELGPRRRGSVSERFDRAGHYRFLCPIHAPGMRMTVIVD
jgi:plastocyanin